MSWFKLVLVLHILGVLALFGAITLELVGIMLLRKAATVSQIGDIGNVLRRLGKLFGPAGALIFLSGIYMTGVRMSHHESVAWVAVSVILFVAMAVSGQISGKKMEEAMGKAMAGSHGAMTPELERLTRRNPTQVNAAFGPWVVAGLVVLMVFKPNVLISIIILLVSLVIGFITHRQLFVPQPSRKTAVRTAG